jgi:hypothetical protein
LRFDLKSRERNECFGSDGEREDASSREDRRQVYIAWAMARALDSKSTRTGSKL